MRLENSATALACAMLYIASAQAQNVSSTFDTDADNWLVVDTPDPGPGTPPQILATYTPTYFASGGDPGGYISIVDPTQGPTFYWYAPPKFLGDQGAYYGKRLSFDIADSGGSSYFMAPDVILVGAGLTLEYALNASDYPINEGFVHVAVPLNEVRWTDATDGTSATATQMQAVLAQLGTLMIRGEYLDGPDTGSLDNVTLVGDIIFDDGFEQP